MASNTAVRAVKLPDLVRKFQAGEPMSMVTSYDVTSAAIVNDTRIDMILVGDSLGMVMLGRASTTSVTMDEMLHHCRAVRAGAPRPFVIGDMPFGSYEASDVDAVHNGVRLMKEGAVDAVKLEGGARMADRIRALVRAGVPVMGHIGLTPQTASNLGGFVVQGNSIESARSVLRDALAVQEAGAFAMVIEMVPELVATHVTRQLSVPTIGIGAGVGTSGQVLVWHDMLGLYRSFVPKFCKQYATLGTEAQRALEQFHDEVAQRHFPQKQHKFLMKRAVFDEAFPDAAKRKQAAAAAASAKPGPRVAVIGGGSLGSFVAAQLAANADIDVALLTKYREHADLIEGDGLRLVDLQGATTKRNVRVFGSADAMGPADIVIVAVKSAETDAAMAAAARIAGADGIVVSMQNGFGVRERMLATLGDAFAPRVAQAVTTVGALLERPGVVKQTGAGDVRMALPPNAAGGERWTQLASLFSQAGMPTTVLPSSALSAVVWRKAIVNCAINPLTALFRVPNGALVENAHFRALLTSAVAEAVAVAQAEGIAMSVEDALTATLDVCRATATNRSSMLRDVTRGVPTEAAQLNAVLVQLAAARGIAVPTHAFLTEAMAAIDEQNKKQI
jgi:3-methyl-2-oxobutanoate hydroxymethyltransferase